MTDVDDRHQALIEPAANVVPEAPIFVAVGTPIWLLKEFRRSRHSGASTEIALVSAMAAALAGLIGFASFVVLATVLPHPAPVDPFEHVPMPLVGLAIIVAAWVAVARLLRDI
jgi:hypothetical protein